MLAFKDLSVSASDTHILTAVTGFVLKGGVTAVLGPSSAGKELCWHECCCTAAS
jgi:ABC-type transporter Mla maintaining outer membrane lipid asymmetry ATPase subunit MlaF